MIISINEIRENGKETRVISSFSHFVNEFKASFRKSTLALTLTVLNQLTVEKFLDGTLHLTGNAKDSAIILAN